MILRDRLVDQFMSVLEEFAPLLLLPLKLLGAQVVELRRQLEVLGVRGGSECLRLSVQLSSDWLSSLEAIPPLLHQLQGIRTLLW